MKYGTLKQRQLIQLFFIHCASERNTHFDTVTFQWVYNLTETRS